jgi:hypothetical protein
LKPRTRARRPGPGTARGRAALPRSWARPARGLALVESPSALDCSAASPQVSFCATPRGRVHSRLPRAVPRCVLAAHARKGILPACRDCLATTAAKTAPVLADRCMPMAGLSRYVVAASVPSAYPSRQRSDGDCATWQLSQAAIGPDGRRQSRVALGDAPPASTASCAPKSDRRQSQSRPQLRECATVSEASLGRPTGDRLAGHPARRLGAALLFCF